LVSRSRLNKILGFRQYRVTKRIRKHVQQATTLFSRLTHERFLKLLGLLSENDAPSEIGLARRMKKLKWFFSIR